MEAGPHDGIVQSLTKFLRYESFKIGIVCYTIYTLAYKTYTLALLLLTAQNQWSQV